MFFFFLNQCSSFVPKFNVLVHLSIFFFPIFYFFGLTSTIRKKKMKKKKLWIDKRRVIGRAEEVKKSLVECPSIINTLNCPSNFWRTNQVFPNFAIQNFENLSNILITVRWMTYRKINKFGTKFCWGEMQNGTGLICSIKCHQ